MTKHPTDYGDYWCATHECFGDTCHEVALTYYGIPLFNDCELVSGWEPA